MIYKSLETIELDDLKGLRDRKVREGSQLDYKDTLPKFNDDGKKEFLRDVTAMANTDGGDLIYGLREERDEEEKTAIAGEVIGIEGLKFDETRLWMENLIRDNTDPRLIGVRFHPIPVDKARTALIARVPRSWNGPHAVSFGRHWRFYARNSGGNYAMNAAQLRDAFLANSSLVQKLENFRSSRIEALRAQRPRDEAHLVTHLQPFESALPGFVLDMREAASSIENLTPGWQINASGMIGATPDVRFNFDGVYARSQGKYIGYVQVYRSGVTEELDTELLNEKTDDGQRVIDAIELERVLFRTVGRRLALLKELGVSSPVMLQVSLLGVQNFKLKARTVAFGGGHWVDKIFPDLIDRDDLLLPGQVIENIQDLPLEGIESREPSGVTVYNSWNAAKPLVRPLLDTVWNAAGLPHCLHYDDDGKWQGMINRTFN
jgi:hypothetical protein